MNEFKRSDLLILQSAELTAPTAFCPEDQLIAEYFDGRLPESIHHAFEHHLADCRYCLARIGMLHRQQADAGSHRVLEETLATAKQFGHSISRRRVHQAPAWAAAAVIVIAMFLILSSDPVQEFSVNPGVVLPPHTAERQMRTAEPSVKRLDVLSPSPGTVVAPGSIIRWDRIPGNTHYSIYVLSPSGDSLWSEHLQNSEWVLPDELALPADGEIFFRVEAELPAGGKLSSQHLLLRAANGQ